MAWPRKTLKLRVDRDLAEALVGHADDSLGPDDLSKALRAHADCERERQCLLGAIEHAGRDFLTLQHRYRDLEVRYENLIQENAALVTERRRLNETIQELHRQNQRG